MRRIHFTLPERKRDGEASMALLAGGMCEARNDSCSRKHKYARTSHGIASESLSRGVYLFFAQDFCFIKQEHGPSRGSKQAKTDVLLTTVVGPLRGLRARALRQQPMSARARVRPNESQDCPRRALCVAQAPSHTCPPPHPHCYRWASPSPPAVAVVGQQTLHPSARAAGRNDFDRYGRLITPYHPARDAPHSG